MVQKLIQRIFKMRTAVSRLSNDVAKIGGPNDTTDLRKKVQDAIFSIQKDASNIKEELFRVVPDQKNRHTAKVVSDFEVSLGLFQSSDSTHSIAYRAKGVVFAEGSVNRASRLKICSLIQC